MLMFILEGISSKSPLEKNGASGCFKTSAILKAKTHSHILNSGK